MVVIYLRQATIPDRPVELYDAITRLVLESWDAHRGVRRESSYASFGVDEKRRFLADVALELFRRDLIRFDETALLEIYSGLAQRFSLPPDQARQVVRELESHNGLLVESGVHFEFSHLSLQEYFAADAVMRGPRSALATWWLRYPAVAAVATALASDANGFLAELVEMVEPSPNTIQSIQSFLYRLGQERPRFEKSDDLGRSLLKLVVLGQVQDANSVAELGKSRLVQDSVLLALRQDYQPLRVSGRKSLLTGGKGARQADAMVVTDVLRALVSPERLAQITARK